MKKEDIVKLICFLFALQYLTQPNFGFVPLDGFAALGQNIVPTGSFVGAFWFIQNLIKKWKERKNIKTTTENK